LNGTGKLIMMAVIGILVAAAIIGVVNAANPDLNSGSTTSTSTVTSRIVSTSVSTTIITSVTTSVSNSTAPEGTMAVQIADSISLPAGITHVYLQYSDIEIHTNLGGSSIWLRVAPENDVDLTTLSTNGLTVGVADVPAGNYDSARFTIVSAAVTFEGSNMSAIVPQTTVSVPIQASGVDLLPNGTSGFLFDIAPSIIPVQSGNLTQMELLPYAEAVAIPSSFPTANYAELGSTIPLNSQPWFTSTQENLASNVTLLAALVSNDALLVVVKNTGNASVTINELSILAPGTESSNLETIVTTITTVTTITEFNQGANAKSAARHLNGQSDSLSRSSAVPASSMLSGYQTAASFLVLYNGQVVQASSGANAQQLGLVLAPGQNASLTFIGKIQTLDSLSSPYAPLQILPGAPYLLEVQGPFGQIEAINVTAVSPF
jgi:hypothetical protein